MPEPMRVIVCGGRDYSDELYFSAIMDQLHSHFKFAQIIHGCAKGADTMAGHWANQRGLEEVRCPADWEAHGRRAGLLRNEYMASLKPDMVIAFPGGRGTKHMLLIAEARGITTMEIQKRA